MLLITGFVSSCSLNWKSPESRQSIKSKCVVKLYFLQSVNYLFRNLDISVIPNQMFEKFVENTYYKNEWKIISISSYRRVIIIITQYHR